MTSGHIESNEGGEDRDEEKGGKVGLGKSAILIDTLPSSSSSKVADN